MKFDFDPSKSKANKVKHGISLLEAEVLWEVPAVEVPAKVIGEVRVMRIGKVGDKLYSCIYTCRGGVVRLISARRSRKQEEGIYYEYV